MRRLIPALLASVLAAAEPSGAWQGAIQLPNGPMRVDLSLEAQSGGAWSGSAALPQQQAYGIPLKEVRVQGRAVAFSLAGITGDPSFVGRLSEDGARIEGTFSQGGRMCPFHLARPGAAAPAAPTAAGDRELSFAGFNGVALKGSVRAAEGRPWFAVMVADAGPADRDWASPLLPPGHAGRDLAAWLAARGLGSLRWDKRFVGLRDPKLDVSLDAQVGDLRAALRAARALPEAKGRRILLVGHGEGALLSLLAAGDADALLLLGLPAKPMGEAIQAQVAAQLPQEAQAANLGYLREALDAVRRGTPAPEPGAAVLPGLVQLVKGLVRPETLAFVRETLDLDPMALAARCPVPLALAYGDRDVQAPPPERLPAGLRADLVLVPEANHLLRRETRARGGLTPATAATAYGDGTPLADLAPLAAWLERLK